MIGADSKKPTIPKESSENEVIEPKRARNLNYNEPKSSLGAYPTEVKLFPLELRPVLDKNIYEKQERREYNCEECPGHYGRHCRIPRKIRSHCSVAYQQKRECSNTPDVYSNILGPTPDESILAGLQTVIDICGLIDNCREDVSDEHLPPNYVAYALSKTKKGSNKNINTSKTSLQIQHNDSFVTAISDTPRQDHPSNECFKPSSATNIRHSTPICSDEDCREPISKKSSESISRVVSKNSSSKQSICGDPQSPSTDFKKSTDTISYNPTSSNSWCKVDACCGSPTPINSIPCVKLKARDGREVCIKYRCRSIQSSLSAKCFPPVEIPPCNFECGKCVIMAKNVSLADLDIPIGSKHSRLSNASTRKRSKRKEAKDKEVKAVVVQDPRASVSLTFDPAFACNRNYPKPNRRDYRLCTNYIRPSVQPVTGVCSGRCSSMNGGTAGGEAPPPRPCEDDPEGGAPGNPENGSTLGVAPKLGDPDTTKLPPEEGGERLLEVRYALVRISMFSNYTTYEIMKSSKKKPRKVPDGVEGIFVTKR